MSKKKKPKMNQKEKTSKEFLVVCKYPKDYKAFDPRANKPICYLDKEPQKDASMVIQEIENFKFPNKIKGKKISFDYFAPNNIGLLLSNKNKAINRAKEIYKSNIDPLTIDHSIVSGESHKHTIEVKSKFIYDFIEEIQTAVVFGYTAIEAFTNLSIPNDYEFKTLANSKGIVEIYDKPSVERWLSLKVKISEVLTDIYKTKSLKMLKIWNSFNTFEQLRNELIHQKSINETDFYKKYFNPTIYELCQTPEKIIEFFFYERADKKFTNSLWPWIINTKNDLPISYDYNSKNFEITGNIFEGRKNKN